MTSSWFRGFDFDELLCKKVVPRYIPQIPYINTNKPMNGSVESISAREEVKQGSRGKAKKPAPEGWDRDF